MTQSKGATLVTGGLGFIGSAFIRRQLHSGARIVNVDLNTYAGDSRRLPIHPRLETTRLDITSPQLDRAVEEIKPTLIVHFAAESHVTRSEAAAGVFFRTNVEGTRRVLEAARRTDVERVVHVSTDEVYGPCTGDAFTEEDKAPGEGNATSAYARSKALADDLARDYASEVPIVVVRPTNCFGPWQHPEKALARWITRALRGLDLPVWGDGGQTRDWMFVEDACSGVEAVMKLGIIGETYNLGPQSHPMTNLEVAKTVARLTAVDENRVYLSAYDRPQHDRRYAIDSAKLYNLGWRAATPLEVGISHTVQWYAEHRDWWTTLIEQAEEIYSDGERMTIT